MKNPETPDEQLQNHGKILDHDAGTGEIAEDEIESRARELSMIAGRRPGESNAGDRTQAVEELRGRHDPLVANDDAPFAADMTERDGLTGGGESPATDVSDGDETIGEALYNEGVAEATHDQMVESRRGELLDQALEDDSAR